MKYQLIGKNDYLNPVQTILNNRGVTDIREFLNPSKDNVIHYSKLKNIKRAVECLLEHIKNGSLIFIQVDSDPDGNTSSTALIDYLQKHYGDKINIEWTIHEGKQHGVILDKVPEGVSLVIIPDAGSNQYKEHKVLSDKGIDVIVLDHHECEKESEHAIVVNNQLSPEYTNKQLSGVGVVYKFLQALDEELGVDNADNYLDLVAVGNIADVMDSRSLETRYYMLEGLKNIKNKFLKTLFDAQEYSIKGIVNIINTAFYIVPLINAAIRTGTQEEKINMMKAFLGSDEQVYYERGKKYESIQDNMARTLKNLKAKQGRIRDKGTALIEERIAEKNLLDNKFLIVNVTGMLDSNLTGLVATQVANKYKRPAILLRQRGDSDVFSGSTRGYEKGEIKDLKAFLNETGKFNFVEGHANAAGAEITAENLIEVNKLINEKLKDVEVATENHEVDFIIGEKSLSKKLILSISELRDIWGNRVEEPLFAFSGLTVNKDEINFMGKKENTLKFTVKGIEFIKFFVDKEEIEEQLNGDCFELDVVGRCSINEYQGKKTPQVFISDFTITKNKKKSYIF